MIPFTRLSFCLLFIFFSINCFGSLPLRNPNAKIYEKGSFLTSPLPIFENTLKSTTKLIQNVIHVMTSHHFHHNDDIQLSNAILDCLELLRSNTELFNWSLSAAQDPLGYEQHYGTGHVSSDLRTWLSAVLANQVTCIEGFEGHRYVINKWVTQRINQVTEFARQLLNMVEVKQLPRNGGLDHKDFNSNGDLKLFELKPNVTVAQDGSGNFTKVMDAVLAAPNNSQDHFIVFVKRGVYEEYVNVETYKWNLVMVGEGMNLSIISGNKSVVDGWDTFNSATFAVHGQGFIAVDMGFENTAGPEKHQAVALLSTADQSAFYRCMIDGYQDTLFVHSNRQFYRECIISGTVDFIFGNSAVVFQLCLIAPKNNGVGNINTITASGRNISTESTGFTFQFCSIVAYSDMLPSETTSPSYLGRPWGMFSRTIFMQSYMDSIVVSEGWLEWNVSHGVDNLFYGEYNNIGPGAEVGGRVKWAGYHVLNSSMADDFTVSKFIQGDFWLPITDIPYTSGLDVRTNVNIGFLESFVEED